MLIKSHGARGEVVLVPSAWSCDGFRFLLSLFVRTRGRRHGHVPDIARIRTVMTSTLLRVDKPQAVASRTNYLPGHMLQHPEDNSIQVLEVRAIREYLEGFGS